MARKLKVYGWQGHRVACPPADNGSRQTREFCAVPSKKALAALLGVKDARAIFNLSETGNRHECELALAEPGTIFWHPYGAVLPRDLAEVRREVSG